MSDIAACTLYINVWVCVSIHFLYGDSVLELQIPFLGYLTTVCLCLGSTAPFNFFYPQCFLQSLAPRTVLIWEKSITLIGSEVGSIMIQAVVFISIFFHTPFLDWYVMHTYQSSCEQLGGTQCRCITLVLDSLEFLAGTMCNDIHNDQSRWSCLSLVPEETLSKYKIS